MQFCLGEISVASIIQIAMVSISTNVNNLTKDFLARASERSWHTSFTHGACNCDHLVQGQVATVLDWNNIVFGCSYWQGTHRNSLVITTVGGDPCGLLWLIKYSTSDDPLLGKYKPLNPFRALFAGESLTPSQKPHIICLKVHVWNQIMYRCNTIHTITDNAICWSQYLSAKSEALQVHVLYHQYWTQDNIHIVYI